MKSNSIRTFINISKEVRYESILWNIVIPKWIREKQRMVIKSRLDEKK